MRDTLFFARFVEALLPVAPSTLFCFYYLVQYAYLVSKFIKRNFEFILECQI